MNDDNATHESTDSGTSIYPSISDYLVTYSTIPGHVSIRNNKNGSIFITTLVKILRKHANEEYLITMLERITNEVTEYKPSSAKLQNSKQIPELWSTLRKKVYFNTGKYKCD